MAVPASHQALAGTGLEYRLAETNLPTVKCLVGPGGSSQSLYVFDVGNNTGGHEIMITGRRYIRCHAHNPWLNLKSGMFTKTNFCEYLNEILSP